MTIEFKTGDRVKWVDPDNELEMIFGEVVNWCPHPDRTGVRNLDVTGLGWVTFVKTADLHHAHEDLSYCTRYFSGNWEVDPIVPPEKKGYQPDGFDREAFDDFMRNLS